jgi:hypothetical protein
VLLFLNYLTCHEFAFACDVCVFKHFRFDPECSGERFLGALESSLCWPQMTEHSKRG